MVEEYKIQLLVFVRKLARKVVENYVLENLQTIQYNHERIYRVRDTIDRHDVVIK